MIRCEVCGRQDTVCTCSVDDGIEFERKRIAEWLSANTGIMVYDRVLTMIRSGEYVKELRKR